MKKNYTILFLCFIFSVSTYSQNIIDIKAEFDVDNKNINIEQTIQYYNTTDQTEQYIYLNDWSNSYSSKTTPLAERFAEEFKNTFHFAKNQDRGFTTITSLKSANIDLHYERLDNHPDVLKVKLDVPFTPKSYYNIKLKYTIQVPDDKFTRYGIDDYGDYFLRYWYITPAVFDGKWHYYSNKNLDDAFVPKANISLQVIYPKDYTLISELDEDYTTDIGNGNFATLLTGKDRVNSKLFLNKVNLYKFVDTDYFKIQSNIDEEDLKPVDVAVISDKVASFITKNLGNYPHRKVLLTKIDYKKDPIYGLNLLPDFVRPFSDGFQYELKLLKTTLRNYLENTLLINPRLDQWVLDGIQTFYLMKYVEEYYPDMKILGNLGNVWGVRAFHASDLKFNDQYNFLYLHMARSNIDQPIGMQKDSLLKFNKNIANKYKAGVGLKYLDSYTESYDVKKTIKQFLKNNKLKHTNAEAFKQILTSNAKKDISWFFEDYVNTNKKIDFKIKKVEKTEDSIRITLRNKRDNKMPISLFTLKDDTIVSKQWIEGFKDYKTITIANNDDIDKLALNYDEVIPEFNRRNNFKSLGGFLSNNKPLQFRLFKDVEDPNYNQVFFMPEFDYNFYDGFSPGLKLYNKTLLTKNLLYKISPKYATKSKQIVGSASISYTDRREATDNNYIKYGISGEYFNYAPNLSYTSYTPFVSFRFRDHKNLRDNANQSLTVRYVNIDREVDLTGEFETEGEPKYSVFNANYRQSNPNLKNFSSWNTDLQLAKDFGKLSGTLELRKLTENNRQYNLRLFAGAFLYNKTFQNTNFYSFALDRPTDYLFDYNYLGRSEETGILSQQLIIAEGGFKSQLEPAFANEWMTTANASTTIWRYIMAYGDLGLVANRTENPKFVYDAGIRLNLVEDYFELYLPIYSNKGWEIAQPNYDQSIRFIVTLSPKTLLKLFTRRWY